MKIVLDFILGFGTCIFVVLGFSGIKSFFTKNKEKKLVKKVSNEYQKIDNRTDTRSDLDVLRKQ